MSLWLQRSHGDHSYWDVAAANFKHAIGLSCELVVEHVNSFIHSGWWCAFPSVTSRVSSSLFVFKLRAKHAGNFAFLSFHVNIH